MNNERFSIFPCGYWNEARQVATPRQRPQQTQTIGWVGDYIKSERARRATEELRRMMPTATREEKQRFKLLNFEYATFSGTFMKTDSILRMVTKYSSPPCSIS